MSFPAEGGSAPVGVAGNCRRCPGEFEELRRRHRLHLAKQLQGAAISGPGLGGILTCSNSATSTSIRFSAASSEVERYPLRCTSPHRHHWLGYR